VGRSKIEFRPLLLIEAEAEGAKIKVILQNAETIRLVTAGGSKPVTELKAGDEVLAHLAARGGRHFGVSVADERVIER
jgi:3-dehydroquinate synthase II